MSDTSKPRIFSMRWEQIHSAYIAKAERKDRTRAEVDEVISWFTGYDVPGIAAACQMRVFGTGVLGTRYCRVPGSWYRAEGYVGPGR